MNLVDLSRLSEKVLGKFRLVFRFVAECMVEKSEKAKIKCLRGVKEIILGNSRKEQVMCDFFREEIRRVLDVLYPPCCPVCDEIVVPKEQLICQTCFEKLSFVKQPVCKKCGKELFDSTMEYCSDCSRHRRSFEYGLALLNYDEHAQHSMTRIKYKNKRQYLDFYIEAICRRYQKQIRQMNADALIPVPIHSSRRRKRGFNQAEILASGIGGQLGIPVLKNGLLRNKKTIPQKQLSPAERLKNLEQAFTTGILPENVKSVILIDDIYTTGSTIEACTRVLKRAGVESVYFVAICIGMKS